MHDGVNYLFTDSYAKYWSKFSEKSNKLIFFLQNLQQFFLFWLRKKLVPHRQHLQLTLSSHLKWKILIQGRISEAFALLEADSQAFLQVPYGCIAQYLHIFLVDALLKTAICWTLDAWFKIQELGLRRVLIPKAYSGILIVDLEWLEGKILILFVEFLLFEGHQIIFNREIL